jgi:two-component system chemotaxis response regulator CheY
MAHGPNAAVGGGNSAIIPHGAGGLTMPARILIADDAAFMRVMIKGILTKQNYEIVGEAKDGREAVELYKQLRPDIVTMDIIMPEVNGIEAVKEIMKIDSDAVIIMCSAMGQQAMVIEAIAAGAKDFVIKPFQPPRVIEAIERALAK